MAWKDISKNTRIGIVAGGLALFSMVSGVGMIGESVRTALSSDVPTSTQEQTDLPQDTIPVEKAKSETRKEKVLKATAFNTIRKNDSSLAKGKTRVTVAGKNGEKTITYRVTYVDGYETKRAKLSEKVTRKPITKVIAVGTYVKPKPKPSNCDPNYSPCIPNVSYDLDCPDIGPSVRVIGYDHHRFDADNDGYGCEWN